MNDDEAAALLLPDTLLPPGLTADEERQACRALKGSMLRQEVYADDAPPGASGQCRRRAATPYTVVEQNVTVHTVQHEGPNRHAVFVTHARETLTFHYEREPADPRIQHAITLEVDGYGNVVKQVAIGYGRRTQITVVDDDGTKPDGTQKYAVDYRIPVPAETRAYELTGFTPNPSAGRFVRSDFVTDHPDGTTSFVATASVDYEQLPAPGKCRRLIEQTRTAYRPDDFGVAAGSALALQRVGELEPAALAGESYKLAFTPGLLDEVYQRAGTPLIPNATQVLGGGGAYRGGYVRAAT